MKKLIMFMCFVSCSVNAEPITVVGALSIASSLYTLSNVLVKQEEKEKQKEDNILTNYHFENIYDENCNCIKKIIVKSINEEALY